MRGHTEIVQARIERFAFRRIDIDVLQAKPGHRPDFCRPGIDSDGDAPFVGRIEVTPDDNIRTLDLRCCHGVPVVVFSETCADGWPVVEQVLLIEPKTVALASGDAVVRVDETGETTAWEP